MAVAQGCSECYLLQLHLSYCIWAVEEVTPLPEQPHPVLQWCAGHARVLFFSTASLGSQDIFGLSQLICRMGPVVEEYCVSSCLPGTQESLVVHSSLWVIWSKAAAAPEVTWTGLWGPAGLWGPHSLLLDTSSFCSPPRLAQSSLARNWQKTQASWLLLWCNELRCNVYLQHSMSEQ